MFDSIRKHQSWLWTVIGFLIIVSFVYFFLPTAPNQGANDLITPTIGGKKMELRDLQRALRQARLAMIMQYGPQLNDQMLDQFVREGHAYQRLFLDHKIREYGIDVPPAAMAQVAKVRLESMSRFGIKNYDDLVKYLQSRGYSVEDLNAYARHEAGVQRLTDVIGVTGKLVTPQQLEDQFRKRNEQVLGQVAVFNASNFLASVKVDPAELATYYTNQMAEYRLPPKVQISFVAYPFTNFLAEADQEIGKITNLTQRIESNYAAQGTNAFTNATGQVLSPEEAKTKIKEDLRRDLALRAARRKALDMANVLFDAEPKSFQTFEAEAKKRNLPIQTPPEFPVQEPPKNLPDGEELAASTEQLTPEEPFGGPIVGTNAVYVTALRGTIPSQNQPLDAVKDKVETTFKKSKSEDLARKAAEDLKAAVEAGLKAGKTFESVAAEKKVPVVKLPPLSLATTPTNGLPPGVDARVLRETLTELKPGTVSEPTAAGDTYFVAFAQSKQPVSEETFKKDFPSYLTRMRTGGEDMAYQEWLNIEFMKWLQTQPKEIQQEIMGNRAG